MRKIRNTKSKIKRNEKAIEKMKNEIKAYTKGYYNILVAKNNKALLKKLKNKTRKLEKLKTRRINLKRTLRRQMNRLNGIKNEISK